MADMESLGGAIVLQALKGVVLLAAVWAVTAALRRVPPAWRHALWLGGLVALVALPALSLLLPAIEVPVLREQSAVLPLEGEATSLAVATPAAVEKLNAMATVDSGAVPDPPTVADQTAVATGAALEPGPMAPTPENNSMASREAARARHSRAAAPITWTAVALAGWLTLALLLLTPYGIGRILLWRLGRACTPLDSGEWTRLVHDLCASLGIRQKVRLISSSHALVPMTWGVLRPTVLLPAEATSWAEDQKRMVLAHELAHVRRWDCLSDAFARCVRAFYWFNPLAWLALRRLHIEREAACDAWVLRLGHAPSAYANALVTIARGLRHPRYLQAAGLAMARSNRLEGRVRRILRSAGEAAQAHKRLAVTAALVLACAALVLALVRPAVLAEDENPVAPLEIRIDATADADAFPKLTIGNLPFEALQDSGIEAPTFQVNEGLVQGLVIEAETDFAKVLQAASRSVTAATIALGAAEIPGRALVKVMDAFEHAGIENVQIRATTGGVGGGGGGFGVGAGGGGFGFGGNINPDQSAWQQLPEATRRAYYQQAMKYQGYQGIDQDSVTTANKAQARAQIHNKLKQMGLVLKMYANEHQGKFPPRSSEPGVFQPEIPQIYPEYLADEEIRDFITGKAGKTVVYTGYVIRDEAAGLVFLKTYRDHAPQALRGEPVEVADKTLYEIAESEDIPTSLLWAHRRLQPLREGVERFYITDINDPAASARLQSEIPIMWTMPEDTGSSSVLFMDGHVEEIEYPGRFPMTEAFIQQLQEVMQEPALQPDELAQRRKRGFERMMGGMKEDEARAEVQNHLKQMGLVFKMYANEQRGQKWPVRAAEPGIFQPEIPAIYPEYMADQKLLDFVTGKAGEDVVYTGYALPDEAAGLAYLKVHANMSEPGRPDIEEDVEVDGITLLRLREGVERFYITDINDPAASARLQSEIPVMWTMPRDGYGHVLFMDGHVEQMEYPGRFPMTQRFIEGLRALIHEPRPAPGRGAAPGDLSSVPLLEGRFLGRRPHPAAAGGRGGVAPAPSGELAQRAPVGGIYDSEIQNQLKQMGLVFKMFANENKGYAWPPRDPARFIPQMDKIYPEYIADPQTVAFIKGELGVPVVYTGYALHGDEIGATYIRLLKDGHPMVGEDVNTGDNAQGKVLALKEGIERFFITDINNPAGSAMAQAEIPVLWTMPRNNIAHVLFMDGHTEKLKYPGKFPMTQAFIEELQSVINRAPASTTPAEKPGSASVEAPAASAFDTLVGLLKDAQERGAENSESAAPQEQLKKMGMLFRMYADEHDGEFPRSVSDEGIFMPKRSELYPEWVTDPALVDFFTGMTGKRVVYTGYALPDEASGLALMKVCKETGINTLGSAIQIGGERIYPLKEGVWNDPNATGDPQHDPSLHATMPVMWTMPDDGSGSDVLFRDGHVEHLEYPSRFPMTERFIESLNEVLRHPVFENSSEAIPEPPDTLTPEQDR